MRTLKKTITERIPLARLAVAIAVAVTSSVTLLVLPAAPQLVSRSAMARLPALLA
jgi:hypothetical protein